MSSNGDTRLLTPANVRQVGLDARGFELGPYEVMGEIARGGMGVLYRAKHKAGGLGGDAGMPAEVALKVVLPRRTVLAAATDMERFFREIKTLITLRHPHIVRIFDAGKENGLHFYSMELVRGRTLKDFAARRPISLVLALDLVREVAQALGAMHERDLLHRDVKPANILLDQQCSPFRAVLIDFGLIQGRDPGVRADAGEVAGTPAYMAPEQTDTSGALGKVGPRSDLYGLGAVLYYLITRRSPFIGTKAEAVMEDVRKTPVKPPSSCVSDLPPSVEAIVLRCLEKRPEDRYPHMSALAAALAEEIARARKSLRRENIFLKLKRLVLPR